MLDIFTRIILNNSFTFTGKIIKHFYSHDLILNCLEFLLLLLKLLRQSTLSTLLLLERPFLSLLFLPRYCSNFLDKCVLRFDDIDRI